MRDWRDTVCAAAVLGVAIGLTVAIVQIVVAEFGGIDERLDVLERQSHREASP